MRLICQGDLKRLVPSIRATMRENLTLLHANNKGANQPVHTHSLINA